MIVKLLILLMAMVVGCSQAAKTPDLPPRLAEVADQDISEHLKVGECAIFVHSNTRTGHLKISGDPNNCDPADEKYFPTLLKLAAKIAARTGAKQEIYVSIPFPSPVIIENLAPIVASSVKWKSRPKLKNSWDSAWYPLITVLLNENREVIYSRYSALLTSLGYSIENVEMEKLGEFAPKELPCCESVLKKLGFSKKNKFPYPLMTVIRAKAIAAK